MTRAKFEHLCESIFKRLFEPCKKAMQDAGIDVSKIDEVILVGGSTRIPKVQQLVKEFFGKEPNRSVNPDEVVSIGAAIQGGVLAGDVTDMRLLDVTPLSLGLETLGGIATRLIDRNTTIPTRKAQVFSTAEDSQSAVDIHVVQGEREFARDNKTLGMFRLDGLPTAKRGIPQIEVAFDIDANGILHVSAKDLGTGKEQKITISNSSGLAQDEVERLVREAQEHQADDKKRREIIEKRNQLENLVLQIEKTLSENKDTLPLAEVSKVEQALEAAKATLKEQENDADALQKATDTLMEASYKIAEIIYQSKSAEGQAAPTAEQPAADDQAATKERGNGPGPIDADFEENK